MFQINQVVIVPNSAEEGVITRISPPEWNPNWVEVAVERLGRKLVYFPHKIKPKLVGCPACLEKTPRLSDGSCLRCGGPGPWDDDVEEERLHSLLGSRPSWQDYFLGLAFITSRRSQDQHTQHGSVIVDPRNNRVLAMGYNGHPRGMDSSTLPLTRPNKYAFFEHSEVNAIANMTKDPWDIPGGPHLFVTGTPCFDCSKSLCRHNILTWFVADRRGYTAGFTPEEQADYERLVRERGVKSLRVKPDLSWVFDGGFVAEMKGYGFLPRTN